MLTEQNHIVYKTFDDLATELISELELDNKQRPRIIRLLVRAFSIIYRELMPQNSVTVIKYMTNTTLRLLDYPEDMDDWTKIGVLINRLNGTPQILTLSINENIYRPTDEDIIAVECTCQTTDVLEKIKATASGNVPADYMIRYNGVIRSGQNVGEMYGVGGGESMAGSVRPDPENMRFVFSTDIPVDTPIVLEYKPNGKYKGKYTKIHDKCTETMIAFAKWKMLHSRNSNFRDRSEAERLYYQEYKELRNNLNSSTIWEILDLIYESASLTY